jgi:hypothetical protein
MRKESQIEIPLTEDGQPDYEALSPEELAQIDEDEVIEHNDDVPAEEKAPEEKGAEETPAAEEEEKAEEEADTAEASEEGKNSPPAGESEQPEAEIAPDVAEKRIKDLQAGFTKKAQEAAELRKKNQELLRQIEVMQREQVDTFKERTQEELEELKQYDPDAYIANMREKEVVEQRRQELETSALMRKAMAEETAIEGFLMEQFPDVPFNFDEPDLAKQDPKVREIFESGKIQRVREFVHNKIIEGDDGYTADDYKAAYLALFGDEVLAQAQARMREDTVAGIQNAPKGSPLDKVKGKGRSDGVNVKKFDELTPEEIAEMSPEEVDEYLAKIDSL